MKKLLLLLPCLSLLLLSQVNAATTSNSPAPSGTILAPVSSPAVPTDNSSFASSVGAYFTSLNPDLASTFGANPGTFWVGVVSAQGQSIPIQNEIGISYAVYKALSVEAVERDGGVTGGIISAGAGLNLSAVVVDTKLTLAADFVRDVAKEVKGQMNDAEISIRAAKALTTHTFAQIQFTVRPVSGVRFFGASTGFTF